MLHAPKFHTLDDLGKYYAVKITDHPQYGRLIAGSKGFINEISGGFAWSRYEPIKLQGFDVNNRKHRNTACTITGVRLRPREDYVNRRQRLLCERYCGTCSTTQDHKIAVSSPSQQ